MRGLLIAIEGINGCGKSTIIDKLKQYFHQLGREVCVYKFPDRQGYYGTQIDKFLRKQDVFRHKYDMFHAFAANRMSVKDKMATDIKRGAIVICDRYIASGVAYHIPFGANAHTINAYQDIIGYFDKHLPVPAKTYLISGNYLHLRNESGQRFHYDKRSADQLFDIFKKIIPKYTISHTIIYNAYDKLDDTIAFMVNDIIQLL
jgi:thymidylate kinase